MKYVTVALVLILLAGSTVAGERTSRAAGDETPGGATVALRFPEVAKDQTRPLRVRTQEAQDPTYYDPELISGGTIDLCVSGSLNADRRCSKDEDLYVCIEAIGRTCRSFVYPNKFVCKTCFG